MKALPVLSELQTPSDTCALCVLRDERPDILATAHGLLRRGLATQDIARRMLPMFADAGITPPLATTYDTHLRDHLNATALIRRLRVVGEDNVEAPPVQVLVTSSEIEALDALRADLDVVRERYCDALENAESLEPYHVVAAAALFKEGRAQIESRGKLRVSEEQLAATREDTARRMLEGIVEPLGARLREVQHVLQTGDLTSATNAIGSLRTDIRDILVNALNSALERSVS
jgi:hypothetical protein